MTQFQQWLDEQGTVWRNEEELARKAWNAAIEAAVKTCNSRAEEWSESNASNGSVIAEDCAEYINSLKE